MTVAKARSISLRRYVPFGVSSRSGSKSRSRRAKRTTRSGVATSRLTAATSCEK